MKLVAFFFILLTMDSACAQFPSAIVYTVVGKSNISNNGKKRELKQHSYIFEFDTVEIKPGGILMVLTVGKKFIELRQPGKFPYHDLEKSVAGGETINIMLEYFHLIYEDMLRPETKKPLVSPETIGAATGGASRGNFCNYMRQPQNFYKTADDTVVFKWRHIPGASRYRFQVEDDSGNEILKTDLKDTMLVLAKSKITNNNKIRCRWSVVPYKNNKCDPAAYSLTFISQDARDKEINEIVNQVSHDQNIFIYYLTISNKLGMNGWYKEAFEYYLKAKTTFDIK